MTIRTTRLLAVLLLTVPAITHADQPRHLSLHDPWIREVPPVSDRSAGYVRIDNTGTSDRALVGADSEMFERVELHQSREGDDGTMRMVHLQEIALPAGETTALEPGSYHIMLIDRIGEPLSEAKGDAVPIRLQFDDGESTDLEAPVRRHAPDHGHARHGMEH